MTIIELNITNNEIPNMEKIKNNKENDYKIIYSNNFNDSKYNLNIINFMNLINENLSKNLLKTITKNDINDEEKSFIINGTNIFNIKKINHIDNYVYTFLHSYINRIIFNLIEEKYNMDKYSLFIKFMYFVNLDDHKDLNYSTNIIKTQSNNFEFILAINIGLNNIKLEITNETIILKPTDGLFFCNKKQFIFLQKTGEIILLFVSIFDGYNRHNYNKHPNEEFF